jgi:uncharacterized protein
MPSDPFENSFRVLALDGGGVRGLYTASLLHSLAAHFATLAGNPDPDGYDVGKKFDLIAGTSTGGILACGLASGKTTGELIQLYDTVAETVFTNPQPIGKRGLLRWAWRNRHKPANPSEPLREALTRSFGATETLGTAYARRRIALCIPACRILDWSPKVFKTPHCPEYTRDRDVTLVDVSLATSAAPIFLAIAEIQETPTERGRFVDGGLWANNPITVALTEALEILTAENRIRSIELLSVGTSGGPSGQAPGAETNQGIMEWRFGSEAASMSVGVQAGGHDHVTRRLAKLFNTRGVPIRYGRIHNPAITAEQAAELRLDRATKTARQLLRQLGDARAQFVESECANRTELGQIVQSIFLRRSNNNV